jgi:hypothetical protein
MTLLWSLSQCYDRSVNSSIPQSGTLNSSPYRYVQCPREGDPSPTGHRQPEQLDACSYSPLWRFLKHKEVPCSRIWWLTVPVILLNRTFEIYPELFQPFPHTDNFFSNIYFKHYSPKSSSKMSSFKPFSIHSSLCISCSLICPLYLARYVKTITVWRDQTLWPHLVTHQCYTVIRNAFYLQSV